jgi:hypothetical protein
MTTAESLERLKEAEFELLAVRSLGVLRPCEDIDATKTPIEREQQSRQHKIEYLAELSDI